MVATRKRLAASPEGLPKKKLKRSKQHAEIEAALRSADLPTAAIDTVIGALPFCLEKAKSQHALHRFQEAALSWAERAMDGVVQRAEIEVASAQETFAAAEQRKETLAAAMREVQAEWEAVRGTYRGRKLELAEAARDFQAAKQAHTEAEQARVSWPKELFAANRLQQEAEVLLKFTEYLHETPEVQIDEFIKSVVRHTGEIDDSLRSGIPVAFLQPPIERGIFDKMVIEQVTNRITKRIDELRELITNGDQTTIDRQDAVDALKAPLKTSQAAQTMAARAYLAAKDDFTKADSAIESRRVELRRLERTATKASKEVATAEAARDYLVQNPVAQLQELATAARAAPVEAEDPKPENVMGVADPPVFVAVA
jgi:chromosome segregation ATPase